MTRSVPTLVIFAKQPVAGQVKTRLCPPLSSQQASDLYQVCLTETVQRMQTSRLRIVLCHAGPADWFRSHFPGVELLAQSDGDLGTRLNTAADTLFAAGAGPLLLIGSDSPDLPLQLVEAAVTALEATDLVTIPSRDGGYVLIGLRAVCPAIFAAIPWSTPQVLAATRIQARRHNLGYREIGRWYDLDEADDLRRLLQRSPDSATARHIGRHLPALLPPLSVDLLRGSDK
ncbi:MAG: TIGR04282 family arsenosugar biosynthesis glycosyltransferase [Desulfuromonadales bacterium]|nr:TIGR04282 family arsenosugar biosynthesis glycosyltransferase [Desulfuromonadales bacterium]